MSIARKVVVIAVSTLLGGAAGFKVLNDIQVDRKEASLASLKVEHARLLAELQARTSGSAAAPRQ